MGLVGAAPTEAAPTQVPLVTFYNPSTGDHFTTSQAAWTCKYFRTCTGSLSPYQIVGLQGHVYNPDNPPPAGTVPLYHWWSAVREDNFLTSDPAWAGSIGERRWSGGAEYVLFRIEGYLQTSGWMALKSYWNSSVADNAAMAMATWRAGAPAGYSFYRTEGYLLPPDSDSLRRCETNATTNFIDPSPWPAHGNSITTWSAPADFLHGDTVRLTALDDWYRIDYWGNQKPVRGYYWDVASSGFPAPGEPRYALLARVTTGRIYASGRGWYEANAWVRALGESGGLPGMCMLYDATGVIPGDLQTGFNDDNISDNGGWANVTVQQWW